MELNEYQEKAMETCMPSSDNFSYMMLNLVGEVGEFASKVAKGIRKEHLHIGGTNIIAGQRHARRPNHLYASNLTIEDMKRMDEIEEELKKEAGDIMWQISGLCEVMGWTLEEVCQQNLDKLASRQQRGVIDGEGDNR